MSEIEKKFISLAEAARDTPYSQEYLGLLVRKGKLPAQKFGRNWYVTGEVVKKYTEGQKKSLYFRLEKKNGIAQPKQSDIVSDIDKEAQITGEDLSRGLVAGVTMEDLGIDTKAPAIAPTIWPKLVSGSFFRHGRKVFQEGAILVSVFALFFATGIFSANFYRQAPLLYDLGKLQGESFELKNFAQTLHAAVKNTERSSFKSFKALAAIAEEEVPLFQPVLSRARFFAQNAKETFSKMARYFLGNKKVAGKPIEKKAEIKIQEKPSEPPKIISDSLPLLKEVTKIREVIERRETVVPADVSGIRIETALLVNNANKAIRDYVDKAIDNLSFSLSRVSGRAESSITMVSLSQKIDKLDAIDITNGINLKSGDISVVNGHLEIAKGGNATADSFIARRALQISGAGSLVFGSRATTTILASTVNAFSIATSSTVVPFFTFDTSNYRVGIGTTTPAQTFSVGGAGNGYFVGGLGIGVATTTAGNIQTSGDVQIGGALTVAGVTSFESGNIIFNNQATSTIPNLTVNAWSIATSTSIVPILTISTAASPFGLIGLGTTSPFATLSIQSPAGTTQPAFFVGSTTKTSFVVSAGGNVGIGTTSPGALFSLASPTTNTNVGLLLSGINTIYASSSTSTIATALNAFSIATSTSAIPMLTFDSTNSRVGFGTTTPGAAFSVAGTGYFGGSLGVGTTSPWGLLSVNANGIGAGPQFAVGSSTKTDFVVSNGGLVGIGTTSPSGLLAVRNTGTGLTTYIEDESGDTTPFVIDASGLVGIGTSTPATRLSVFGDTYLDSRTITLASSSASTLTVSYQANATSTIPSNNFNAWTIATSTTVRPILSVGSSNGLPRIGVGTSTPYAMFSIEGLPGVPLFNVGSSSQTNFIVDEKGNVGIGTTTPATTFAVAGSQYLTGGLGVGKATTTSGNFEITGSALFGDAQGDIVNFNAGTLSFANAATTTLSSAVNVFNIGSLLSFDTANSRVGIGTSTPGTRLSITGGNTHIDSTILTLATSSASTLTVSYQANATSTIPSNNFNAWTIATSTTVTPILSVGSSGGLPRIGVGTSTPYAFFSIEGLPGQAMLAIGSSSRTSLIVDSSGFVGLATATPYAQLSISAPASTTVLAIEAQSTSGLLTEWRTSSTTAAKMTLHGSLTLGSAGTGKLTSGVFDPPYTLGDKVYASYGLTHVGPIKEETTGLVALKKYSASRTRAVIDFRNAKEGEDLWIFRRITDFGDQWSHLQIFLSSSAESPIWYEKDSLHNRIVVWGTKEGEVSFRLTASRFDWTSWPNINNDGVTGYIPPEFVDSSLPADDDEASTTPDLSLLSASAEILDTNAWSVDQQFGKVNVNFFGTVNLNGNDIINVNKILGMNGKWSIDEEGSLMATRVVTDLTITQKLQVGSPQAPSGITLYDETSGEPYCIKMKAGAVVSLAGECGSTLLTTSGEPETMPVGESLVAGETSADTSGIQETSATTTPETVEITATSTPLTSESETQGTSTTTPEI